MRVPGLRDLRVSLNCEMEAADLHDAVMEVILEMNGWEPVAGSPGAVISDERLIQVEEAAYRLVGLLLA